jgi:hypothetical protein
VFSEPVNITFNNTFATNTTDVNSLVKIVEELSSKVDALNTPEPFDWLTLLLVITTIASVIVVFIFSLISAKHTREQLERTDTELKMNRENIEFSSLIPLNVDISFDPKSYSLTPKPDRGPNEVDKAVRLEVVIKNESIDLAHNINCNVYLEQERIT